MTPDPQRKGVSVPSDMDSAEPEAWRRLVKRDADAMSFVVAALGGRVWALLRRCLASGFSDDDIQDIWAAVFAYVWQYPHRYNSTLPNAAFSGWVLKVARWQLATYLRATRRWREARTDLRMDLAAEDTEPDETIELLRRKLEDSKSQLTEEDQRLLDLRLTGLRYRQIGDVLGITDIAARKRWQHLKSRIVALGQTQEERSQSKNP